MKQVNDLFSEMVSVEAVCNAWSEFRRGKMKRSDSLDFSRHLERIIFKLHRQLAAQLYRHSPYQSFFIQDPKARHIRKACVRDRLVHQAVHTALTRIYDPKLIHHVYSSRVAKGTHRAVDALRAMAWKVSKNLCRPCWVLKCDIRKFYDTVDHEILKAILRHTICDEKALWLLNEIIGSFRTEGMPGKGLPIGNVTSQIFTNIYLNEFDQFVKHTLKVRYYLRFADDMLFIAPDRDRLQEILNAVGDFLSTKLLLKLHPGKISIRPLSQGVDFLGYGSLPPHRMLRMSTRRRM